MKHIIDNTDLVFTFVKKYYPIKRGDGQKGLGLVSDSEMVAGVIYDEYNGHNIFMHVAARHEKNWLTREYLRLSFHYPFNQLGCSRVTGWIEDSNTKSKRFAEHLGFKKEAVLNGAATDGGDVILYRMLREECKYV